MRKDKKKEKAALTQEFNKKILGFTAEESGDESDTVPVGWVDDSPPLKKKKFNPNESFDHLETSFVMNEPSHCSAPLPSYNFTKKNIFYCFWWNVGQENLQVRFKEEIVEIEFTLPLLTVDDLSLVLREETVMNLPTSHRVKWIYYMPPNVKLELSKESVAKIETSRFFGFKGKVVHVMSEVVL